MKLFSEFKLGNITLKNRIVMAPMTRCRAIDNIPNELMQKYYSQRANAGLIITEGVAPSRNGLGYARIPGIYSAAQVDGWKAVTKAVHESGGKIFVQLMHTGRASHPFNMEEGAEVIAPSAVKLSGEMYTDSADMQEYPVPREITIGEIPQIQEEYVHAAINAMEAGFDGVELHGANGYLVDQFINTASNKRTDKYGGSYENRVRFAIETAAKVVAAIGADKTGIRLSPNGVFNDMELFPDVKETYSYLAKELGKLKLLYIHIVDHSGMGAPEVGTEIKDLIRENFAGTIIASGGLAKDSAELILAEGKAELTAFGSKYISNPDLVARLEQDKEFASPNFDTFYTPGAEGYTDYPTL